MIYDIFVWENHVKTVLNTTNNTETEIAARLFIGQSLKCLAYIKGSVSDLCMGSKAAGELGL